MVKAVVFDLDDLLVNNFNHHVLAQEKVLAEFNIPFIVKNKYMGMRVSDVTKDVMKEHGIDMNRFEEIYNRRQEIFMSLVEESCEAMPGVKQITQLVEELGFKKAIASSGMLSYINACIGHLDLNNYFDAVVSGEDLQKGKPDPDTFLVASKKLRTAPEHCIVLEDAHAGVTAAKAAGMYCIGVHNPVNHKVAQDLSAADIQVHSLNEITEEMLGKFSQTVV